MSTYSSLMGENLRVLTRPWKVKKKKDGLMLWEMRLNLYIIIIHYLKTKKLRKIGVSSGRHMKMATQFHDTRLD